MDHFQPRAHHSIPLKFKMDSGSDCAGRWVVRLVLYVGQASSLTKLWWFAPALRYVFTKGKSHAMDYPFSRSR